MWSLFTTSGTQSYGQNPYYTNRTKNIYTICRQQLCLLCIKTPTQTLFKIILNKQGLAIQFTTKYENGNKSLNFLDIEMTDTINRYEFKVHSKKAITNIHINPKLRINLTLSEVLSEVSFTEHTRYVLRNKWKKNKNFQSMCSLRMAIPSNFWKT